MKEEKEKKKISAFEMILIFLCVFFKYLVEYKLSEKILYIYLGVLILLVVLDIYCKKYTYKELGKMIILFVISAYFVFFYNDINFLLSFLMAVIITNRDEKNYLKSFLISSTIMYISTILLYCIGIREPKDMIRMDTNGEIIRRYSLGFNHPNQVYMFFLPIVFISYILFNKKKIYWICIIVTSAILYKFSDCRTGGLVVVLLAIIHFVSKKINERNFTKIAKYSFIILTIISIFITFRYGDDFSNSINKILSGRPYYWKQYATSGKMFTVLGKNYVSNIVLDNFYLYLLIELGIIGYMIYCVIYYKSTSLIKNKNYNIVLVCFLIYGAF